MFEHTEAYSGIIKTKKGGFLIKHAVDVSPGCSGAPIFNIDRK